MAQCILLTTNRVGVLARVTSVVSSLGVNIDSAEIQLPGESGFATIRFCATVSASDADRLQRKLARLIDVVDVKVRV